MGYSFGRRVGFSWQLSLVCAGVASVCKAVSSESFYANNNVTCNVAFKDNYQVVLAKPMNKAELAGTIHNNAIVRTLSSSITTRLVGIQINQEELVQKINNQVYSCLMECKDSDLAFSKSELKIEYKDFPIEYQTKLLAFTKAIAQQDDVEGLHKMAKELLPSEKDGLDLLEQYVIRLSDIADKDNIRSFTEQLNQAIDELTISTETTEYLKTLVSIAENSYSLWDIK